jgi:threonine/homoserine efflux transporter RhtA
VAQYLEKIIVVESDFAFETVPIGECIAVFIDGQLVIVLVKVEKTTKFVIVAFDIFGFHVVVVVSVNLETRKSVAVDTKTHVIGTTQAFEIAACIDGIAHDIVATGLHIIVVAAPVVPSPVCMRVWTQVSACGNA